MLDLRRREFMMLLGGAAAWPLAARAQQPGKLPTFGYIGSTALLAESPRDVAFLQRLREHGWIEGRTVAIEYRWGENRTTRYAEIAAEFVQRKVDIIATFGTAVPILKQATSDIPIVFAIDADPVGRGLVVSLARPGGNVTGLSLQSTDLVGKRLGLLREVLPAVRRLAVLANAGFPGAVQELARRGSGRGRQARPSSRRTGNQASGGHSSRLRRAQGSGGRALYLGRRARIHQSPQGSRSSSLRALLGEIDQEMGCV